MRRAAHRSWLELAHTLPALVEITAGESVSFKEQAVRLLQELPDGFSWQQVMQSLAEEDVPMSEQGLQTWQMRWVDLQDLESTRAILQDDLDAVRLQEGSRIFAPWMWRIQTSHMQLVYGILEGVLEEIGSPGALVQLVEQLLLAGVTVENAQCDNSFSLGQALRSPVTGGLLNLVREYISPGCSQ